MKKISIAAAVLAAVIATPALANEGRVEGRGGIVWADGDSEATAGVAAGYDWTVGQGAFAGVEITGDKILTGGAKVSFGVNARGGAQLASGTKLYVSGGWNSEPCDLCDDAVSAGAGAQFPIGTALYGKVEYRHFFTGSNYYDSDAVVAGIGIRF